MNLPLLLTWLRIGAIPLIVVVYFLPFQAAHGTAAVIFAAAAATDWLDGYLARSRNQESRLGAFLDPVADKLLVAVCLIMLLLEMPTGFMMLVVMIIVSREILVSALREWFAEIGSRAKVAVSKLAKFKTGTQLAGIFFLLCYRPGGYIIFKWIGYLGLLAAVILTLWSMIQYIKIAKPDLTLPEESQ